jgi:LAO/AO transport system kinase
VDIVKTADTTIVVMVPGLGDDIQAIKAGILEIGDVFAVNKADREGVDKVCREIEMMLDLNQEKVLWRPPVKKVIASQNEGVTELLAAIDQHKNWLSESGELLARRSERIKTELLAILNEQIGRFILARVSSNGQFEELLHNVEARSVDPYSAVQNILKDILK